MCGITGAVWTDPADAVAPQTLGRMTAALRPRGPDDEGTYTAQAVAGPGGAGLPGVALGHRRLAIIDLAGGRQPLANEDGSVWVVLNGEIYNFGPLRKQLEARGHRFRTQSDTEVLVHLYEDEGPGMLAALVGMFALALWDARQGQLLLARDRLGQKPLVYRLEPGRLLFASQLKSLLEVPGVPREIDPQALDQYLSYQYVPHPRTIYRGISKLPPGHMAVYRQGRLEVQAYWRPDFQARQDWPAQRYAAELRQRLTEAVRLRLQSDVPLGAFLSGGIDSTIIVGLMRGLTAGPIRTYTIGFPVPDFDETRYARIAARRFETVHEEFRIEPPTVEVLPKLAWHFDEPLGDSSALPTWYLSELTRRQVTVALSGDGGDELFAGYPRYQAVWLAEKLDGLPALRRILAGRLWQRLPGGGCGCPMLRRWKRFAEGLAQSPTGRYFQWISIFAGARRAALYSDDFLAALGDTEPAEFVAAALARSAGRDPVTAASLADLVTYLPCDLMAKVDTASMAHGLECRQPFLDHRVVELAIGMPGRLKFRAGRGKRILREVFSDLLPGPIRRRSKMGFGVPLDSWFRGELRAFTRQILLDGRTLGRGYFRPGAVAQLLAEHDAARANHGPRLWALLVLELWRREWIGD
jgi:asparagine synthase (glutamine-hydrolysing)